MLRANSIFTFFLKQQKRLFSRPSFIILLALIVLMSFALSVVSDGDGGVIRVGLADSSGEEVVDGIINDIMGDGSDGSVIAHFERVSAEEGIEAVKEGKLDAVWIFKEDFSALLKNVAIGEPSEKPIQVVTGEDDPINALSREKMYAEVYPYASRMLFDHFSEEEIGLSREDAALIIDEMGYNDEVVDFETLSGDKAVISTDFIRTTLRGLLSLCVLLCAFACVMYALKDVADGVYEFLPQRSRFFPLLSGVFAGTFDAGVVACLALVFSGNRMELTDILSMLLYVLACTVFAFFVGSLCARRESVGTVLPVVIFVSAILCPVFINVGGPEALRVLMPTYLYLKAYGNATYLLYMVIYTLLFGGLAYPVFCVRTKK